MVILTSAARILIRECLIGRHVVVVTRMLAVTGWGLEKGSNVSSKQFLISVFFFLHPVL